MRVNGLYRLEFRNSKIQDAARVIVFLAGDAAPHGTGQAPLVWAFAQFRNLEDNPGDALAPNGGTWKMDENASFVAELMGRGSLR